jgi:hypothetical protein
MLSHSSLLYCYVIFHCTLLSHFYCYSAQPFFAATVLSHSSCKRTSVIHHCYNTQPFSTAKRCSVILRCYSTQTFFTATVLNHYLLLQCARPLSHFVKWLSSVAGARGGDSRHGRRQAGPSHVHMGMGPSWSRGGAGSSRARGTPGSGALAQSDRGWLVQVMTLVHHPRWWIAAPYIYVLQLEIILNSNMNLNSNFAYQRILSNNHVPVKSGIRAWSSLKN